jgi:hypothetical protein
VDIERVTPSQLDFLLMDAFGDASNPKDMRIAALTSSLEYFFFNIVVPVVDNFDMDVVDYSRYFDIVSKCCIGLARKVRNHFKV